MDPAPEPPETLDTEMSPFRRLRVIELAGDPAGEFTGKLLSQLGADVVKVEPPDGSPTRRVGPFAAGPPDPDHSLTFWFYNVNKRSVVLDHRRADDRDRLHALLAETDLLITTLTGPEAAACELEPARLSGRHPRLIVVAMTPFGLNGPWSDYQSSDLVGLAAGGLLHSCGYDDHSIPPIRPGGNQGYHVQASFALIGALLALVQRQATARGQVVDVAMHDSLAVSPELANPFWFYPRTLVHRQTLRHAQPSPTQPAHFATADDRYVYFALILADPKPWASLVAWLDSEGLAADLVEPAYGDLAFRQSHFDHVQGIVEAFFMLHDAETLYREGQARGLPIGPVNAPDELFSDEHLAARGFFERVEHVDSPAGLYPGSPFRFSAMRSPAQRRAPRLGEHTEEVEP